MAESLRRLPDLFKARLSRRIVMWVFASIVVIEAIILVPSVYRRERELLSYLRDISTAKASGILETKDLNVEDAQLLQYLETLRNNSVVLGGALYRTDGTLVGAFGELPELAVESILSSQQTDLFNRRTARYDAVWEMSPISDRFILVIRHDAIWVQEEFFAFIGRISGLVLIIALFVTTATMVVLERILITPILMLRRDLLKVGNVFRHDNGLTPPKFDSVAVRRNDEIGDVSLAFHQMVQQISDAIAERNQAEANLRLSEEKFSKAFRASPDAVIISSLTDGRLIEVNESFRRLAGVDPDQVIGRTVMELGLWADLGDRTEMIQTLQREGMVRNREYRFRTPQGEIRTALYSAELIQLDGRTCILSVINDITERKQAEEALRMSEMRFRTLVEQAVDAFFVVNAQAQVIDVNQQACESLGYAREELLSLTVPEIDQQFTRDGFNQFWQQLKPNVPLSHEGIHRRKDGTTFPVEIRLGLLQLTDEKFLLALVRDVTERKRAEEAVARLAEIGELASMIVHEVRNPLTTVLMGLNSFKRMELPERANARLTLALEESERLQRLLNEILMYAKDQMLHLSALDLNDLFGDLLESLSAMPAAQSRRLDFSPASSPAWVMGDRDKLKQVFINLISNACEAIPDGEVVTWRVERDEAQSKIRVWVHNGGDPIPPDVLPRLTKPFFTTKSSGNGLGLAITKRIVEAHQGNLTIESSADRGTTVTVTFPVATCDTL